MGTILTRAATMLCPHGGTITATVAAPMRAKAGDAILTDSDTFLVSGCGFMIGPNPHPCMQVRWIVGALQVKADSAAILTTDSTALCLAADQAPQGPPTLIAAQQQASAT